MGEEVAEVSDGSVVDEEMGSILLAAVDCKGEAVENSTDVRDTVGGTWQTTQSGEIALPITGDKVAGGARDAAVR